MNGVSSHTCSGRAQACTGSPPRLVFSAAAILPVYALTVAAAAQGHAPALFSAAVLPAALLLKLRHWPESLFSASSAFDRSPLHSHSVWHLLVWAVQDPHTPPLSLGSWSSEGFHGRLLLGSRRAISSSLSGRCAAPAARRGHVRQTEERAGILNKTVFDC